MMRLVAEKLDIRAGDRPLVRQLDWHIASGQCWFVYGRNGAGKTSLLQTMAGVRQPDGGGVFLDGIALADWPSAKLAKKRAYLPQKAQDAFGFTVSEVVSSARFPWQGGRMWTSDEDRRIVIRAMEQMAVSPLAERDIRTLSGGERQRVAIATLLAQDAPLMLLDEPVTALDLAHQAALVKQMASWCREADKAVVSVVHDLNLAWQAATHILLLYGDGHWEAGNYATMMVPEKLSACLGCPVKSVVYEQRPVWMTF